MLWVPQKKEGNLPSQCYSYMHRRLSGLQFQINRPKFISILIVLVSKIILTVLLNSWQAASNIAIYKSEYRSTTCHLIPDENGWSSWSASHRFYATLDTLSLSKTSNPIPKHIIASTTSKAWEKWLHRKSQQGSKSRKAALVLLEARQLWRDVQFVSKLLYTSSPKARMARPDARKTTENWGNMNDLGQKGYKDFVYMC